MTMGGLDLEEDFIETSIFGPKQSSAALPAASLSDDFSGHGGGDLTMVEEFLDILLGNAKPSPSITSLDQSLESHYCALAAEISRKEGGKPIRLEDVRTGKIQ